MTEKEMPKLEWVDGKADVSKWFGEEEFYSCKVVIVHEGLSSDKAGIRKAKQIAEDTFHEDLQKPMSFAEAMAAVARGCEVVLDGERVKSVGFTGDTPPDGRLCNYNEKDGKWLLWNPHTEHITATDWYFHFPDRKEPEKIYAVSVRAYQCPECDSLFYRSHPVCKETDSQPCPECGVMLHRPAKEQPND